MAIERPKLKNDDIVMRNVAKEIRKMGNKSLTLLDVGSAEEHLKDLLPKNIRYSSLDVKGKHDYIRDLDKLPLKINKKFDIIVALEVLEHTQRPHEVMKELLKLSNKDTIFFLSMPNEYNFYCRLNYLIAKKTSVQEPFMLVEKHRHIHQPRVVDIFNFFSKYIEIKKAFFCWYSRTSEHGKGIKKKMAIKIDKMLNYFSKKKPSLLSRNVLVTGKRKN